MTLDQKQNKQREIMIEKNLPSALKSYMRFQT